MASSATSRADAALEQLLLQRVASTRRRRAPWTARTAARSRVVEEAERGRSRSIAASTCAGRSPFSHERARRARAPSARREREHVERAIVRRRAPPASLATDAALRVLVVRRRARDAQRAADRASSERHGSRHALSSPQTYRPSIDAASTMRRITVIRHRMADPVSSVWTRTMVDRAARGHGNERCRRPAL